MSQVKHVVLVVCDALAAQHMSLYGYEHETTPRIEQFFGQHGQIYTRCRSNASWTFLSMPSMLRSQMPSAISVSELAANQDSFTTLLGERGVQCFGHVIEGERAILQNIKQAFPSDRVSSYRNADQEQDIKRPFTQALEQLQAATDPTFIMVHTDAVHMPYAPPASYRDLFGPAEIDPSVSVVRGHVMHLIKKPFDPSFSAFATRLYDQGVRYFDDVFADFVEAIPEPLRNETAIILTSDHGETFGQRGNMYSHGGHLYDDLIRVPLCMYIPGRPPAISETNISLLDMAPTICELFGVPASTEYVGQSVLDMGQIEDTRAIGAEGRRTPELNPREDMAHLLEQYGAMKLIEPVTQRAITIGSYKYHIYTKGFTIREFVFNVETDPHERDNLLLHEPYSSELREFYRQARTAAGVESIVQSMITG